MRHQPAGDGQHLLLAAGEQARPAPRPVAQPREPVEQALDLGRVDRRPAPEGAEADVLDDGELREDLSALRHQDEPAAGDPVRRQRVDAPVVEHDRSRDRAQEPRQRPHGRRLAGAVRAQQRDGLARPHVEMEAVEDGRGAVAGGQVEDGEDGVRRSPPRRAPRPGRRVGAAEIGAQDRRVAPDRGRCPPRDRAPGIHDEDMVGDAHHQRHVVLDQHHRDAAVGDPADQPGQPVGVGPRQAGGRLVEEQHCRAAGERPGDLHEPPVDVGQLGGRAVERPPVADEGEERGGRPPVARAGPAPEPARREAEGDVVDHRERAEQARGLVGARDAGAGDHVSRSPGEIAFAQPDRPGARAVEARDHVEQCGLAGPVRADHAGNGR